ncbi:carbamate kinase [Facklamia sp. DSM 111018]|uniref:Carbamate kinase n=1 Tax=Facklamia lactis TaxID=2749967 RepID=A0ABS0LU72_9LACT|nr:carbamate kinase [Facklamia lactis]MBG9986926.1 carbamate kinase [Facklamia lactis]
MSKKIVVALGGNAILSTDPSAKAQQEALESTAKYLVELIKQGNQLVISHGNGPQVGNLLLQQSEADSETNPAMPLDTCVAMTQGSIGYWLQNAMKKALESSELEREVASIVTQVVVDKNDSAFTNLTKPIGPFISQEAAEERMKTSDEQYVEDAGRGYRKVVASPKPIDILEASVIKKLVEQDVITVSAGGGGIPVVETETGYQGIEAVIDKDFSSAKLAELLDADFLLILTGVDHVYVNYNQPDQQKLENVTVEEMTQWIREEQFAPGSMLPKVEAAIQFVENKPEGKAVITSLENVKAYFEGGSATVITKS